MTTDASHDAPIRVLNVNDTEAARYTITRMLQRAGFAVTEAETGADALARAAEVAPEVVVLDVKLPDLSGFEVCRRLKTDPATASVAVLLTSAAFIRAGDRVQGLDGGADAYLVQPAEAIELVATVRALVRARRAEVERTRSLERERHARAEAEAARVRTERLYALAGQLSEAATVAQVAAAVLEHLMGVLGAGAGALMQIDARGEALELVHAVGYPEHTLAPWRRIVLGTHVALTDAVRLRLLIVLSTRAEWDAAYPHLVALSDTAGAARGARAAVPLIVKGQAVGALALSFAEYRAIDDGDRDYLLAVAAQCAQALERARLYDAERRARAEAEEANRIKDDFLATVSHELRTPLNAILGWARMLRTGALADGARARALESLERNARAQTQIVEDLLEVSRIVAGKLRVEFGPVDLVAVTEAALDVVRPTAEAKGVTLDADFSAAASGTGAAMAEGDADRLQQVVWNLLTNALKFTPRGGRVAVRLRRDGAHHLELEVRDTGDGIKPDFLPHVFDRFRQADASTTRQHGGLGLGLAIVRHLVELHGGGVRAASEGPGQGATFTVRLPTRAARASAPGSAAAAAALEPSRGPGDVRGAPAADAPSLAGLYVLLVDDEPDTRELVQTVLQEHGAEVAAVGSAGEALEALEAPRRPDVLLSDIGMPGEDGYALIRAVRARERGRAAALPAAALTAYARADDVRRVLAAGFQRHVAKPIEPSALVEIVATLAQKPARASSAD